LVVDNGLEHFQNWCSLFLPQRLKPRVSRLYRRPEGLLHPVAEYNPIADYNPVADYNNSGIA